MNNMHEAHHSNLRKGNYTHKAVNNNCAGLDVHRDFVSVTTLCGPENEIHKEYREFKTMKQDLLELRDWLLDQGIAVAGIESTGKYWYPIYNVFAGVIQLNVYNSRYIKNIPGKKTDKLDSEWIARNTRFAELKPSFIPPPRIRDTRMLARTRKAYLHIRGSNRQIMHGYLESSSIKIGSVLSDVFGQSGRKLLNLLTSDTVITPEMIEQCLHGRLKCKLNDVIVAMDGYINKVHKSMIRSQLTFDDQLTSSIKALEDDILKLLITNDKERNVFENLTEIPGVSELSASLILAEVGFDLESFPSADHFCSWAGLVPGKYESAGKNRTGKIHSRKCYMRTQLVELALSASRSKGTFYSAKYYLLKSKIGPQKAIIAIAHKIAKAIYKIIKEGRKYEELGEAHVLQDRYARDLKALRRLQSRLGTEAILIHLSNPES